MEDEIALGDEVARKRAAMAGAETRIEDGHHPTALHDGRAPDSVVEQERGGVGYGLVAWSYLGAAWAISGLLDGNTSTAALVTVMAAQHLAVLGRVHARMKWGVWLGQRVSLAKARAE